MSDPETKRDKALAKRRQQILEAAVMCFLENGYHQTGVREIAKRAGISIGNLYNHFSGKHDVLAEIATLERAELEPFLRMLAEPGPEDVLLGAFIDAYGRYVSAPENVILTLEISCEAIRKPDIAAMFADSREGLVGALGALIARGVRSGRISAPGDPDGRAHLIIELIEGAAYRVAIGGAPRQHTFDELRAFVIAALRSQ